jgi:CRISPR-associated endonuclease/helicase Cas3
VEGYRHEFGSLAIFELGNDWANQLPAEARNPIDDLPQDDFVLHLIAAYQGRAGPVIETRGCEDRPPSALEARAHRHALPVGRRNDWWRRSVFELPQSI